MFEFQYSLIGLSDEIKDIMERQYVNQRLLMPLMWGEHCIECSAPECYFTCNRYMSRADGHCARFERGIEPIIVDDKIAARIIFKPWSKLEAKIETNAVTETSYLQVYKKVCDFGEISIKTAHCMPGFKLKSKCIGAWEKYRKKLIKKNKEAVPTQLPTILQYTIVNNANPTALLIDIRNKNKDLLMREKVDLPKGKTSGVISLDRYYDASVISIHPANADERIELVFEELEVRCANPEEKESRTPKKVKCVIWDLDNTLWNGVLVENNNVQLKPELIELIRRLDVKGIVNSIASKNNEDQVMKVLEQAGVADLFVFKKINWNPKSQNIQKTIKSMNINANTIVFVDDNQFEREEVKSVIPEITCVDPSEILSFVETERFDVPVSDESALRRHTYKMLEQLKKEEETWSGSIDSFLVNCQITLTISKPTQQNLSRCYELLQRTNQLNSSGRRINMDQLTEITNSTDYNCYVMESTDKFGDYGIVGFMIVKKEETFRITDFVISCRVANKKIEPTLINYLAKKYGNKIKFDFKKTKLNGPMKMVIDELQMEKVLEQNELETYLHNYNSLYPNIVTLTDLTNG